MMQEQKEVEFYKVSAVLIQQIVDYIAATPTGTFSWSHVNNIIALLHQSEKLDTKDKDLEE